MFLKQAKGDMNTITANTCISFLKALESSVPNPTSLWLVNDGLLGHLRFRFLLGYFDSSANRFCLSLHLVSSV